MSVIMAEPTKERILSAMTAHPEENGLPCGFHGCVGCEGFRGRMKKPKTRIAFAKQAGELSGESGVQAAKANLREKIRIAREEQERLEEEGLETFGVPEQEYLDAHPEFDDTAMDDLKGVALEYLAATEGRTALIDRMKQASH